nr:alkyl sulfatase C-terminal domain-containing protein [Shewanella colwelliana]
MMGAHSFDDKIKAGKVKMEGDSQVINDLMSSLVTFTMAFELLPGTLPDTAK